ncbi:MAG: HypC/HybG/HupF family hydrogenase formation chaperone [Betaproteobacteria bacterium]|nr:HypC/HybG/HupF family hydrogenase formation chaperone [Betaproteobacteria bacterium]
MCIGIPMQIVESADDIAVCEGRGARARINCLMIGAQEPGTWVLTFQGTALRVLGADEAAQTNAALDALAAVLAGDTETGRHFADLAGREPELPAHLRGPR